MNRSVLDDPVVLTGAERPVELFQAAHEAGRRIAVRTSGSTSEPRYVLRTTTSWIDSFDALTHRLRLGRASRVWVPGPRTGSMNLFAEIHAAHAGAAVTREPQDATHAVLTPARLQASLDELDLHGKTVVVAGDHLDEAVFARATERGAAVHHYYGAAELSFVAWGSHAGDLHLFPGVAAEIRDGEIWVSSPYLCLGYTSPGGPLRRDDRGFMSVGDRGELRATSLSVHGRSGGITTAGETVVIADVEAALAGATRGRVLIVPVPHNTYGDLVAAVVTEPTDHPRLKRASRELLEAGSRPRIWFACDRLPLTDQGKIDRRKLADLASTGTLPRLS